MPLGKKMKKWQVSGPGSSRSFGKNREIYTMITIRRTNSQDPDFLLLVNLLDKDLEERYGHLQQLYDQFNKIEYLDTVVIAYSSGRAAGCVCFKNFEMNTVEVKRMFVREDFRGKGIGRALLNDLENWAAELGMKALVLELGNKQPEALHVYQRQGFRFIPCYEPYTGMDASICMKKIIAV